MFHNILLVGLGGFIGTLGRYFCVITMNRLYPSINLPISTLFVNVLGCFLIGLLGGLGGGKQLFAETGRLFLFTGILGGFTTYSAFGIETFYLMRSGQLHLAFLNILLQLVCGIGAVAFGYWLSELF